MLKQILNKTRYYLMDLARFINDDLVVSELLSFHTNKQIQTPKITKTDWVVLSAFIILASLIIIIIPLTVHNKRTSTLEIFSSDNFWHDFSLQTGSINRKSYSFFKSGDNQAQLEMAKLVSFLSTEIITKAKYNITDPEGLAWKIVSESFIANEDPFFVAALIFSESSFRTHARSNVGARGLMQLMPKTGEYIAKKINYQWQGLHTLDNPTVNLRLGISYLQYLEKVFSGDTNKILVAYNWGPSNVKKGKRPPEESLRYSAKIQKLTDNWKRDYFTYSGSEDFNILQKI